MSIRTRLLLLFLALSADLPIVPVRFAGGLPIEAQPGSVRLEFPLGYAKQDIYIGRPIMPHELATLPLAERRDQVRDALNRLGPDLMAETPNPPDLDFAAAVARWVQECDIVEPRAAVLHALEEDGAAGQAVRLVVDGVRAGYPPASDTPEAVWLGQLWSWFTGSG